MNRYLWETEVIKDGHPVRLTVETTDDLVERDRALPQYARLASLTFRNPQTVAEHHHCLAVGAFMARLMNHGFESRTFIVERTKRRPRGPHPERVHGGDKHGYFCGVWETLVRTKRR